MKELKKVLMERDDMSEMEADELIAELTNRFYSGEDPEELFYEIGLELDYIMDII